MVLRNLSPGTIYQRRRVLARLIAATGGRDPLTLTVADLEAWQAGLTLGPSARRTEVSHVVSFYRWCTRFGVLVEDPSRTLIRPKLPRHLPRPIPEDELSAVLAAAPDRVRPWLVLAAWCGLRACEVAVLDRADVLDTADPPMLVIHGKGGRDRLVPIGPRVLAELSPWLPARGPLFRRLDGRPGHVTPHLVSKLANEVLHQADVPATFHALRHRYATRVYQSTRDIRATQELLGHASPSTTAVYAAFARREAVDAVLRLDEGLVPA